MFYNFIIKIRYKLIQIIAYIIKSISINFKRRYVWLSIGDSLTKPCMYQVISSRKVKYKIINWGIGGTTLAYNGNQDSMCRRFKLKIIKNVKLISLMFGTNDFGQSIPIGEIDSNDEKTFYGALNIVIPGLKNIYPDAEIILITPPKSFFRDNSELNKYNYTIRDYADALIKTSNKYKLKIVDVCNDSKIDYNNLNEYTIDKIHLNIKGHKEVASLLTNTVTN
jgi:lysophospholipase L1-like esterase